MLQSEVGPSTDSAKQPSFRERQRAGGQYQGLGLVSLSLGKFPVSGGPKFARVLSKACRSYQKEPTCSKGTLI